MSDQIFKSSIDAIDEIDFVRAQFAQINHFIKENNKQEAMRLCADSYDRLAELLDVIERIRG